MGSHSLLQVATKEATAMRSLGTTTTEQPLLATTRKKSAWSNEDPAQPNPKNPMEKKMMKRLAGQRAESQAAAVPSPPAWEPGDGPDLCPHLGEGWNSLPAGAATLDRWKHCFQARATTTKKCTTLYIQGNNLLDFSPNISRGCAHKGLDEPGHLPVMPGVLPRSGAEGCWELKEIP